MNIHEWHRNGLQPAFATVEQWITDQLGYMGAGDEACYAVQLRGEEDKAGLAVRILVATDRGLLDMLWERPEAAADRHLTSRHYRWADVRGLHLEARTGLNPETLVHRAPEWGLSVDDPEFAVEPAEEGQALLEFWEACEKQLKKISGG